FHIALVRGICLLRIVVDGPDIGHDKGVPGFSEKKHMRRICSAKSAGYFLRFIDKVWERVVPGFCTLHHMFKGVAGRHAGIIRIDRDDWESFGLIVLVERNDAVVVRLGVGTGVRSEEHTSELQSRE